jgi:hypothetical protein
MYAALAVPPYAHPVNSTSQTIFTIAQAPFVVGVLWWVIRQRRSNATWTPLLLVLGGTLMVFIEPIVDSLGHCWFYYPGQWTLLSTLGVHLPIWILPAYFWFFGGQSALCFKALSSRPTPETIVKMYATVFLADVLLEHAGLYLDVFTYYGRQPFTFTRFPLWWACINAMTPLVAATLALYARPLLRGPRMLLLIIIGPAICAFTNAGAGWPTYLAINTNSSKPAVWLAGCSTLLLAAAMVTFLRAVVREAPPRDLHRDDVPAGTAMFSNADR